MNTNNRSRRGRGRGVSRAVRSYVHRQDHQLAYGRQLKPQNYPGATVEQPWNSAVIQLGGTGDSTITIELLVQQAQKQLGLQVFDGSTLLGSVGIDVRPISIRVWALQPSRPIRLEVVSFTEDASQANRTFTAWPGAQRLPAVGYEWGNIVQSGLYNSTKDKTLALARIDVSSKVPWLSYFQILWKSSTSQPVSDSVVSKVCISQSLATLTL